MKKIKLWIEMIFIFLIPLILMLVSIEIKTSNTYDSNNNIVSTNKYVDIKNIDFLNDETITYTKYNYEEIEGNTLINDNMYFNYNVLSGNAQGLLTTFNKTINGQDYTLNAYYCLIQQSNKNSYPYANETETFIWKGNTLNINVAIPNTLDISETFALNEINKNIRINNASDLNSFDLTGWGEVLTNELYPNGYKLRDLNGYFLECDYKIINNQIFIKFKEGTNNIFTRNNTLKYKYTTINNINYINALYITEETYTLNENVFNKVLNILFGALGIQENLIIQLIIIYLCLWFIMFVIWHCIYIPFDWLIHLVSPKDKGE